MLQIFGRASLSPDGGNTPFEDKPAFSEKVGYLIKKKLMAKGKKASVNGMMSKMPSKMPKMPMKMMSAKDMNAHMNMGKQK